MICSSFPTILINTGYECVGSYSDYKNTTSTLNWKNWMRTVVGSEFGLAGGEHACTQVVFIVSVFKVRADDHLCLGITPLDPKDVPGA